MKIFQIGMELDEYDIPFVPESHGIKRLLEESDSEDSSHRRRREEEEDAVQENENGTTVEDVFSISVVSRKIFALLPISDLFNCVQVSDAWKGYAYEALRMRCVLAINLDRHSYWDLENLVVYLENSSTVPFCGLSLTSSYTWPTGYYDGYCSLAAKELWLKLAELLIQKIQNFTVLKLNGGDSWDSLTELLIERVFASVYDGLEFLEWKGGISAASKLARGRRVLKKLSRLKYFEFSGTSDVPPPERLAQRVVASAPNLRVLRGYVTPTWFTSGIVTMTDFSWLKEFACDFTPETLLAAQHFALSEPGLQKLHISPFSCSSQDLTSWTSAEQKQIKETITKLLKSSSQSLEELIIVHNDLVQLLVRERVLTTPVFANLRALTLYLSRGYNVDGFNLLLEIDFELFFPKLERVEIHVFNPVLLFGGTSNHRNSTVTTLRLENAAQYIMDQECFESFLDRLATLFPNVGDICLNHMGRNGLDAVHECIWKYWRALKTLTLTGINLSTIRSWDAALCGISEEEVTALSYFSFEDLQKYQYAPSRPCILTCKTLRKLRLEIVHNGIMLGEENVDPGQSVISKVGNACALSRIPKFVVELSRVGRFNVGAQHRFSLNHLKGFVKMKQRNTAFS